MQKKPTLKGKSTVISHSQDEIFRSVERILDHSNKSHLASLIAAHVPKELLLKGLLGDVPKNMFHTGQELLGRVGELGGWDIDHAYTIQAGFMLNSMYIYVEFKEFDPISAQPYTVLYKYKDNKNKTQDKLYKTTLHSLLLVNGEEWPDEIIMDNLKASEVEY